MNTPLLPEWHTVGEQPRLLGTRCTDCGTVYFPPQQAFCRNPVCESETFEAVELSARGTLWSYTNASYPPPAPFVAAEPFEPFAIAAVELERERMIVLGPVVDGVPSASLTVGMPMTLAIEALADGRLTWKWRPE